MKNEESMQPWCVKPTNNYFRNLKLKLMSPLKVSILDDSVGKVVNALKENQMLENSVILFFCDNGATIEIEHSNGGSNSPFKGVRKLFQQSYGRK